MKYMIQHESFFESSDGTKLFLYRWAADEPMANSGRPRAVLHIVHGMAEHALRYKRLAEKLTACGIEVWAADQRGHGRTADLNVNAAGRGGLLGHCADGKTFDAVTKDIYAINKKIRETETDTPLFLLGHSWGSFIAQNYIEEYADNLLINGCILSGTRGPGDFKVKAGIPFLTLLAFFCGQRKGSKIAKSLADGPYNKPFKPNRTPFDWLSRDEKEVDKYAADQYCGQLCSSGFYRDLAKGLNLIHKKKRMKKIKKDMPIYVFCGNADPVGEMGKSPTSLVNAYSSLGIGNLNFVQYPGARHETLNEINREEVTENLLSWLNKHS